jgi:integrase
MRIGGTLVGAERLHIRLQFARLLKKAELPKMRFHELRHTAATLMARAGIPVGEVQRILGHKHIRTTLETYTHYAPHDLAQGIRHGERADHTSF